MSKKHFIKWASSKKTKEAYSLEIKPSQAMIALEISSVQMKLWLKESGSYQLWYRVKDEQLMATKNILEAEPQSFELSSEQSQSLMNQIESMKFWNMTSNGGQDKSTSITVFEGWKEGVSYQKVRVSNLINSPLNSFRDALLEHLKPESFKCTLEQFKSAL